MPVTSELKKVKAPAKVLPKPGTPVSVNFWKANRTCGLPSLSSIQSAQPAQSAQSFSWNAGWIRCASRTAARTASRSSAGARFGYYELLT